MEDSPHQRAIWRSELLNAASHQPPDVPAKLPLGREPSIGSADWDHRCHVPAARLVSGDADPRLHALGLPRPRTADGWPMPFAGKDPNGHRHVLDGVMIDTRDYVSFVEPVWYLESVRDLSGTSDAVHRQLEAAAVVNARATKTLFPPTSWRVTPMNVHDTSLREREWSRVFDPLFSSDHPHRHVVLDDALNPAAFAALRSELLSFPASTFHSIGPCHFEASGVDSMRCSVSIFFDSRERWRALHEIENVTAETATHEF